MEQPPPPTAGTSTTEEPTSLSSTPSPSSFVAAGGDEIATWSTDSTCTYNGEVISLTGSLGYDDGNPLFRDAHVVLQRGLIVGVVGVNGSGKTSFVKALPTIPGFPSSSTRGFVVEYLSADVVMDEFRGHLDMPSSSPSPSAISAKDYCTLRVKDRVDALQIQITALENQLELTTDETEIETISEELGSMYEIQDTLKVDAEKNIKLMFDDLNFGENYPHQPFLTLSSGWKYKCMLIASFLTQPDCLIIDEPSFLDVKSTRWFVSRIQELTMSTDSNRSPSIVLLISHKENLMEEVCQRILYINPSSRTLMQYSCTFREFQKAHEQNLAYAEKANEQAGQAHADAKQSLDNIRKQLNKREGNMAKTTSQNADKRWIRGKNKEAKQKADHSAAAKVKRLQQQAVEMEKQQDLLRPVHVTPLVLVSAAVKHSDRPLVELVDVDFKYDDDVASADNDDGSLLLRYVNCQISGKDKIILDGPNGQGKSTLVNIIMGNLDVTNGEVRRNHMGVVAYFPQDALLDMIHQYGNGNAIDFLQSKDPHLSTVEARGYMGRFGLTGDLAMRQVKTLSAGQRVRLWLAREFLPKTKGGERPSMLVLDEVTENLDKDTTDSLLESLETFDGAVLSISHDEYFASKFPTTQRWKIQNGYFRPEYV